MFVIIFVTSLVTLIVLLITTAAYLISLIWDESDDGNSPDALALDTHDFSTTPTVSPNTDLIYNKPPEVFCENPNHLHHFHPNGQQHDQAAPAVLPVSEIQSTASQTAAQEQQEAGIRNHQASGVDDRSSTGGNNVPTPTPSFCPRPSAAWPLSATTQKNLISNQLGAIASKQLFDDFDTKEIQLGGTGLHWAKSRKSIDKLIKMGIPVESRNERFETALHVAARKRKLQVLIGLLCYGADVESRNDNGETPLILSAKANDIYACQLLIVFDANVNCKDNLGLSPRHYAAGICDKHKIQRQLPSAAHLILAMLHEMDAKRCPEHTEAKLDSCVQSDPNTNGNGNASTSSTSKTAKSTLIACTPGCSPSGSYNGNSYNRWPNLQKESLHKKYLFADIIEERKRLKQTNEEVQRRKLQAKRRGRAEEMEPRVKRSRMLCVDGGGMRGVIVCQVLIEMEKYLKKPVMSYFDWIGGTSVGAFMTCALLSGTTLKQLRRITFDVKDEVFSGSKPYNSKFLERVLKRTFGPTVRLSDVKNKKLMVTTVIADRDPCQLKLFRNYKSASDLLESHGYPSEIFNNISGHSIVLRRPLSTSNGGGATSKSLSSSDSSSRISYKSSLSFPGISSSSNSGLGTTAVTINGTTNTTQIKQTTQLSSAKESATKRITATTTNQTSGAALKSSTTATTVRDASQTINAPSPVTVDNDLQAGTKENKNNVDNNQIENVIDENDRDPLMWQAVRASAAAPFFFKPYGPYLDGGIISNNPALDIMTEFYNYERARSFLRSKTTDSNGLEIKNEPLEPSLLEPANKLDMVVSLGTGRGRVIGKQAMVDFGQVASGFSTVFSPVELLRSIRAARDLFKKLMQQSCHTEDHILDRAQAWCSSLSVPYFRINPPLATIFSIDDKRDEQLVNALWQTKLYMRAVKGQLEQLGELLDDGGDDDDDEMEVDDENENDE